MNYKEFKKHFKIFTGKQKKLLASKGNDYADKDMLQNFKQVGYITNLKPEVIALVLIGVKVARLGNLLNGNLQNGKQPKNESVKDSVMDLCNYGFLMDCILEEKSIKN